MYVAQFSVENYKSFRSSGDLQLQPGFNVLVGQNNAGKTALVEALNLNFANKPHRSMVTIPRVGMQIAPGSLARVSLAIEPGEARSVLINEVGSSGTQIVVPIPDGQDWQQASDRFERVLDSGDLLTLECAGGQINFAYLESYGRHSVSRRLGLVIDSATRTLLRNGEVSPGTVDTYGTSLGYAFRSKIYSFKAERLNIAKYGFGYETELLSDASNLARVLHNLQSRNPRRFERFNSLVATIFPEVAAITIPSTPDGQVEILVWTIDPHTERDDLAIRLSESGTGIGQVLAILYVVLTADVPKVIIIDEPQSFLHPAAIRKLMEVLRREFAHHQFIITTHSPEVVTSVNPEVLFLLKKEGPETHVHQLDVSEAQQQRVFLSEIGARLSDVFGADAILWVEGATEEQSYPLIVEKVLQKPLLGTKILGVVQTGDFEGKHSERILQIYDRLSSGSGLIPPAIGFIFDKEGRTPTQRDDLTRRSRGKAKFLARRMYENYLLNPKAIAEVVSRSTEGDRSTIDAHKVDEWLQAHKWDAEVFDSQVREDQRTHLYWLEHVHGARVLAGIFAEFAEVGVMYDKVEHGLALTRWLVDNAPRDLDEVANVIAGLLTTTEHVDSMDQVLVHKRQERQS